MFPDGFNLLVIRARMGRKHRERVSQRLLVELTSKAGRAGVSDSFQRLTQGGHLRVVKHSVFLVGHVYGKGPLLDSSSESGRTIGRLADMLFGKDGLCRDLLGHHAFGHGFLNNSGLIVVGVLAHTTGPISRADLRRYLAPIVPTRTTARAIDRLFREGVIGDVKQIALAENWLEFLDRVGDGRARERAERTKARHSRERDEFVLVSGSPTAEDRRRILMSPCVVCGGPSNEVDHFPPQTFLKTYGLVKRKSRFRAHFSFLNAICTECHDEHDVWITTHAKSRLPTVKESRITWFGEPDTEERKKALKLVLDRWAKSYYVALTQGRSGQALLAIAHALEVWRRCTGGDPELREPKGVIRVSPKRKVRGKKDVGRRRLRRRGRLR